MNILFFIGGASAGWVTYKIYHVFFGVKNNESSKEVTIETPPKEADRPSPVKSEAIEKATQENAIKTKPVKKKTSIKTKKEKQTENKIDDLSKLKGVGPKLLGALDEIGVFNYKQLYTPSIDETLVRLKEVGGKFTRPAISAVIERAKLADKA